jgi:tetratricopeptide (TPR) repeat protein
MRLIPSLSISLFLITQIGCLQKTSFAIIEPQFEEWEKNDEYGRSLDALAQIDPNDPDYTKAAILRKQVEKQAADYEQQVRKKAQQKLKKGDWAAALNQYDEALSKHPRSAVIKDGLVKLHRHQRVELDALERKRLIQHGKWLRGVLPIYRDMARVDPRSYQTQSRLDGIINEAVQISSGLTLLGIRALADDDLDAAEETLPLAAALHNGPVTEKSLRLLRAQQKLVLNKQLELRRLKDKKAHAKKEKKKRSLRDRVRKYDKAFAAQDFITARKHLIAINKLDRRYNKLASMKAELKSAIDDKVTILFETGVSAYSRGEYEQAAKQWRTTLKLDASHQQAKEKLQRAEKVLEKLEKLKVKQDG